MNNIEKFKLEYAKQLAAALAAYPGDYGFNPEGLPSVTARMHAAIDQGTYNHDGRAFKGTCKALGIKHTRKAIEQFIRDPLASHYENRPQEL